MNQTTILPRGEFQTATTPDTLDLTKHASLAIHGVIGNVDPEIGPEMWFHCEMSRNHPYMRHLSSDNACTPKYGELLPMMRLMTGSEEGLELENQMRRRLISQVEDGIFWNKAESHRPWRCMYSWDKEDKNPKGEDLASPVGNARMMRTLMTWREIDDDPGYDELITQMLDGHERMLITRTRDNGEKYSYFPDAGYGEAFSYPRNTGWHHDNEPMSDTEGMEGSVTCYHGHSAYFLSKWYRLTGDERALDMAKRVVNYNIHPRMWGGVALHDSDLEQYATTAVATHAPNIPPSMPSPSGVDAGRKGHWFMHFHGRAVGMRGILEYGLVTGDQRALEFANNTWAYSRSHMMDRIGWIDGAPAKGGYCEGCNLGDFVGLGIRLSDAGVGDYWDDVDACVRNALVEGQFTDLEQAQSFVNQYSDTPEDLPKGFDKQINTENILERLQGVYFAGSLPVAVGLTSIGCCTGNGPMGFYYAWEGAVREDDHLTTINLLLNRTSHSVDVTSWLPYTGRVEIAIKTATKVTIRIPRWIIRRELRLQVDGQDQTLLWAGNYIMVTDLAPGNVITLTFTVPTDSVTYTWNARIPNEERDFTFQMRGSTCIKAEPQDWLSPGYLKSYQRDYMNTDIAPTKTIKQYLPERIFRDW